MILHTIFFYQYIRSTDLFSPCSGFYTAPGNHRYLPQPWRNRQGRGAGIRRYDIEDIYLPHDILIISGKCCCAFICIQQISGKIHNHNPIECLVNQSLELPFTFFECFLRTAAFGPVNQYKKSCRIERYMMEAPFTITVLLPPSLVRISIS